MRWGVFIVAATLGGCANTTDLGNSFSVTVTAFNSGLTAQNQLAVDLEKDFARKSEQLEYVSKGSYSCGDPRNPEVQLIERQARTNALKVQKDAAKSLRAKNAYINAILGYGEVVEAYVKQQSDIGTKLDNWSTAIGTFTAFVPSAEATAFGKIAQLIIGDIKAASGFYSHEKIKQYAAAIDPHLRANVAYLLKTKNLRALTAEEEQAYQLWKACAEERLHFVQQFFPPTYGVERTRPYPSVAPSPVWDFMTAYSDYVTEREGFLGRKPDFGALLEAIVTANKAIIDDQQDILTVINAMGSAVATAKSSADGIQKAAMALDPH